MKTSNNVPSLHAKKLTFITRLFYVCPKEFLLWLYFKGLKKHKHFRFIFFDNLIMDVAYVIRNYEKDRFVLGWNEWENTTIHQDWFTKKLYQKREFNESVQSAFMKNLEREIELKRPRVIADIGCAHGLHLDRFAKRFQQIQFHGYDFEVKEAKEKNDFPNVKYFEGYPLDLLQNVKEINMVYAASTLLYTFPNELKKYFELFKKLGVKNICISDSNINGYEQKNDGKLWSKHMGYNTAWCHNYSGYMKEYGYKVTHFNRKKWEDYSGPVCLDHF